MFMFYLCQIPFLFQRVLSKQSEVTTLKRTTPERRYYIMHALLRLVVLAVFAVCVHSHQYYNETLDLTPLPKNTLLTSFQFEIESLPFKLGYHADSSNRGGSVTHYTYFPQALGPIMESTNTREMHLRFTQGWWDSKSWGRLPLDGKKSGGTGVEVSAAIEAPDLETAKANWLKLSKTLSGFFCASLNFIDDSITTFPRQQQEQVRPILDPNNKIFYLRAALPSEPICTENLTPFLKLLPTRGKAGISSLLDGHKVFDSLWHGMSIDVTTECQGSSCSLRLDQTVNTVVDITRSIRKHGGSGIPKPIQGSLLDCDESKTYNIWQCFPKDDPVELDWSLSTIFGRKINGPAFEDQPLSTKINVHVDTENWEVFFSKIQDDATLMWSISNSLDSTIEEYIKDNEPLDIEFKTQNSSKVLPIVAPPISVSRSLTGYSQDKGGFRVGFTNPSVNESVTFEFFESLPWFMRLYLNTLTVSILNSTGTFSQLADESEYIKDRYFKPALDRKRPSHLEFSIYLPPQLTLILTTQFDKSLLLYHEYPPDANHGFAIEPAVITVSDHGKIYEVRTTSLLLTLPTPDFSMPYNVIILTCTVFSLAFGSIFNLLTKKVITEAELEKLAEDGKFKKIVGKLKAKIAILKGLIKR